MIKIAWHPIFAHPLPAGHRFPMEKYNRLYQTLREEDIFSEDHFFSPQNASAEDVTAIHDVQYVQDLLDLNIDRSMERRIGFPISAQLIEREFKIVQGTIEAAVYALESGLAFNIAGGTHHAFSNRGEGFCLLNDNAVAAQYLLDRKLVSKILIVDLDVHQGNGTASMMQGNNNVFTFSMHGANNFPFQKEVSDLDVPLPDACTDELYLEKLEQHLPNLLKTFQPDFMFYQCGVDILAEDKMGKLNCSMQGCFERDFKVLSLAKANNIPIVCDMGGGYAPDLETIVEAHANTYRIGKNLFY